ncbi:MAG: hypothetical protein IJF74_01950, partial [Clostridia bacterium]|nr:hypothetical protein [Clostridia bacterium]
PMILIAGNIDETVVEHKYSADIVFSNCEFTYNKEVVWNDDEYNYDTKTSGWTPDYGTITVTNHSDCPLDCVVSIGSIDKSYGDLDIVFVSTGNKNPINQSIEAVLPGAIAGNEVTIASVKILGEPTVAKIEDKVLGTITVTVTMVVD